MKISIITATNRPISPKTVKSIINQTNKNFEWVVVVDGRYEGSYLYDEYPETKGVMLWNNYGPSVARNVGFQISSGDIITYLDSDDELEPTRVKHLTSIFDKYPIDLLFSGYKLFDGATYKRLNHFDYNKSSDFFEYIKIIQKQNISIPMGVAHTRKPFVEVGGFQRGIVCGEDGILWRRMVDRIEPRRIMFDDSIAGTYFINTKGQSRTQRRFEEGGFAFDGSRNDNGKYLDDDWFKTYNSVNLFDNRETSTERVEKEKKLAKGNSRALMLLTEEETDNLLKGNTNNDWVFYSGGDGDGYHN